MTSTGTARNSVRSWIAPIRRYERHLSAAGMVLGFAIDNFTFGRIDRPRAHLIFACYLVLAAATIATAHALQTRSDRVRARRRAMTKHADVALDENSLEGPQDSAAEEGRRARWRTWLPAATQFALGGLWSGFLVFYSRSASLAASWLFLATLAAFLVGNEVFRKYHSRLVFASLLLFFAIYSYAVFSLPVLTRTIGRLTFVASGALAVLAFAIFLQVLAKVGLERYRQSRLRLVAGAVVIAAAMNVCYFTGVLPPLPLSLLRVGIYHSIKHVGNDYIAAAEQEPWYTEYAVAAPTLHVARGESLSLYSAVFAPIRLSAHISHVWQRYDAKRTRWVIQSNVTYAITGGRDGGYRAYTVKTHPTPGDWRVDIKSEDGRLIGRLRFDVADAPAPPSLKTTTLR
jgi:hypothetical protein